MNGPMGGCVSRCAPNCQEGPVVSHSRHKEEEAMLTGLHGVQPNGKWTTTRRELLVGCRALQVPSGGAPTGQVMERSGQSEEPSGRDHRVRWTFCVVVQTLGCTSVKQCPSLPCWVRSVVRDVMVVVVSFERAACCVTFGSFLLDDPT